MPLTPSDGYGTAAELAAANYPYAPGQETIELDTGIRKLGDGVTRYNDKAALPALIGPGPSQAHTFTSADVTSADAYFAVDEGHVTRQKVLLTWTPTENGDLYLLPRPDHSPYDPDNRVRLYVYPGTTVNVDYPGPTDASVGVSYTPLVSNHTPETVPEGPFALTAGQAYTVLLIDLDEDTATPKTVTLDELYASLAQLGGIAAPPLPPSGLTYVLKRPLGGNRLVPDYVPPAAAYEPPTVTLSATFYTHNFYVGLGGNLPLVGDAGHGLWCSGLQLVGPTDVADGEMVGPISVGVHGHTVDADHLTSIIVTVRVANADQSEVLTLLANVQVDAPFYTLAFADFEVTDTVGSDLSLESDGTVHTVAGDIYSVTVSADFIVT